MNGDDRKVLKKLIDRDAMRALAILNRRQSKALEEAAADVPVASLPDEAKGILQAIQSDLHVLGSKMDALEALGFKLESGATEFRRYDRGSTFRVTPVIRVVEVTPEAKAAKDRLIRDEYRPKREAIEEAQATAMLNVVAQDLPGVKAEIEALRKTIADVVGPDDEE